MRMTVSRLRDIPGIGVDVIGDAADAADDPEILRLENLDTDLRPPPIAVELTREAVADDAANSYLPFPGHAVLREAAAAHVGRFAGRRYDPGTECVVTAGGLNGILNTLLATVEPGQEVVLCDPVYAGLINRVRLAGGVPRFVPATATPGGWELDAERLAAAVGPATAAVLLMSPCMPTGLVLDERHWSALAAALERHPAWLIYDAAMERIRFDDRPPSHPAAHPGLSGRTITVGSASKELRMIGLASRLGCRTRRSGRRHQAGRPYQCRLPGGDRAAGGRGRAHRSGRRRRRGGGDGDLAGQMPGGARRAGRLPGRAPAWRMVAARRREDARPHPRRA